MSVTQETIPNDGSLMPKKDAQGHMFTEVRCQGILPDGSTCNGWLADLYIRDGRIRLRCRRSPSQCGKITVMVFRPKKRKTVEPGLSN